METKKLKLVSLMPDKYPDQEIDCKVVEDMKKYVQRLLKRRRAGEAKKTADVEAYQGTVGEEVDTRPRVGYMGKVYCVGETKAKVKVEGSMVVKNPDGEEYIVKPEAFAKKYKKSDSKEGIYSPIAEPIKFVDVDESIVFEAPWGGDMFAVEGAVLNIGDEGGVYAIQNEAFKKTYTILIATQASGKAPAATDEMLP